MEIIFLEKNKFISEAIITIFNSIEFLKVKFFNKKISHLNLIDYLEKFLINSKNLDENFKNNIIFSQHNLMKFCNFLLDIQNKLFNMNSDKNFKKNQRSKIVNYFSKILYGIYDFLYSVFILEKDIDIIPFIIDFEDFFKNIPIIFSQEIADSISQKIP